MLWTRNVALSKFCSLFDSLMGAVSKAVPCGIPDLLMLHVDKQIHFALMLARYVSTWDSAHMAVQKSLALPFLPYYSLKNGH